MDLNFSVLMTQALSEWPQQLDFQLFHVSKDMSNYSVKGLGMMADDIADKYINHELEVIYRHLHLAIEIELHKVAKYVVKMSTRNLRPELVCIKFESFLLEIKNGINDCGWGDPDLKIIDAYFRVNGPN